MFIPALKAVICAAIESMHTVFAIGEDKFHSCCKPRFGYAFLREVMKALL